MELKQFTPPDADHELRRYLDNGEAYEVGFVAVEDGQYAGLLLLLTRPLTPMLMGTLDLLGLEGTAKPVLEARRESFVVAFRVEPEFRKRGFGTALQQAAVAWSRAQGLHQMRSWSSCDSPENYRLKLRLGFAAVPGVQYIERLGQWVEGVYFVMPL